MKSYEEFCDEMTAKLNELQQLDEIPVLSDSERTKILRGLHKLSRKAVRLEKKREAARHVNEHGGATLALYQRALKDVQKAQSFIKKAEGLDAQIPRSRKKPPWVTELGKAETALDVAFRNIKIRTGLLVGEIEPKKQENKKLEPLFDTIVNDHYSRGEKGKQEKKWVEDYYRTKDYPFELDDFHVIAVIHQLQRKAHTLLRKHYLSVTDSALHKIIQSFLLASDFKWSVELKTISATLRRK